jgi:hypothetical protein
MRSAVEVLCIWIVSALLICGCAKDNKPRPAADTQQHTLPVIDDIDSNDTKPLSDDVKAAKTSVESAHANVQTVIATAAKSNNAPVQAAAKPLNSANDQLGQARAQLSAAQAKIQELNGALSTHNTARESREKVLQKQIDGLLEARREDAELNAKAMDKLTKENDDLKNEVLRQTKHRLMWIGVILTLIGVGGFVSIFALSFPGGRYIGFIAAPMGAACITIANMLSVIVLWMEILFGAALLIGLGVAAWHLFRHDPKTPKTPVATPNP